MSRVAHSAPDKRRKFAMPRFAGWHRPSNKTAWVRVTAGGHTHSVLRMMLARGLFGEFCVVKDGEHPNDVRGLRVSRMATNSTGRKG